MKFAAAHSRALGGRGRAWSSSPTADPVGRRVEAFIFAVGGLGEGGGELGEAELESIDLTPETNHLGSHLFWRRRGQLLRVNHRDIVRTDVRDVNRKFTD